MRARQAAGLRLNGIKMRSPGSGEHLPCYKAGLGARGPKAGHVGGSTRHEHSGTPKTNRSRQVGSERRAKDRNGSVALVELYGEVGIVKQSDPWREGDTGHHAELEGKTGDTLRSPTVTTKLQRLAEQAKRDPERVFTNLAHLIDEDFLREAYGQTRKSSAAGIDGVTAELYAEHLDENLHDLYDAAKGGYEARGRRVWTEGGRGSHPIAKRRQDKIVSEQWKWCWKRNEQDFPIDRMAFGRSPYHDACAIGGAGWRGHRVDRDADVRDTSQIDRASA